MPSRARLAYLSLLFAGTLATGLLIVRLGPSLPYGSHAREAFGAALLASFAPAFFLVRHYIASRTLVSGEVLTLDPLDIPRREGETFLGYAFPWKPAHAQRLYHLMANGQEAPEETQALFGGNTTIHALGVREEAPLFISDKKRTHHCLVLGSPGEGKTRFLELMIRQLIEKGDAVVIVDPKGDARLIDLVQQVSAETGRSSAFRLVALPWPSASCAYNPLTNFSTPADIADRLIGLFPPPSGESEAFQGFQWAAAKAVVQAMYVLGIPLTIARVLGYLRDIGEITLELVKKRFPKLTGRDLNEILSRYEAGVADRTIAERSVELDDLISFYRLDPSYYMKMVASFLPQLDRLSAGPKREILSPEPKECSREILTWPAVDHQKLVVYFYLGSLHGEASANAVGKMLLLDLRSYIAARYSYDLAGERSRLSLFVDEAHHMISKPFLSVLAEGRGADVAVVLSTQTTAQFEEALRSRAAVDEILTQNFAHVQFQSRNPREAKDFSDLVGEREMCVLGEGQTYESAFLNSGWKEVDDFRATYSRSLTPKDRPLVPTWAIAQLPTFHYFARIGGRLYKGRCPLLAEPTSAFTANLQKKVVS